MEFFACCILVLHVAVVLITAPLAISHALAHHGSKQGKQGRCNSTACRCTYDGTCVET
jgi:hypothetical protein